METSVAALLVRVIVSLGVVLLIMWGTAAVLRRSGVLGTAPAARRGVRRRGMPVEVIARHGLSRTSSLAVVRLGGRALVLGVTDHQVTLLTEVDPAELDALPDFDNDLVGPAGPGTAAGPLPWEVTLEQLRDRTVRRS
jgi:flagellar protein FliO/FliZ